MAEETPKLDDVVKDSMSQIVQYEQFRRGINQAPDKETETNLGKVLRQTLIGKIAEDDPNRNTKIQLINRELLNNPYLYTDQNLDELVGQTSKNYADSGKTITKEIEAKLNADLEKATSMDAAIVAILPYIQQAVDIKEKPKEEVYNQVVRELAQVGIHIFGYHIDLVDPKREVINQYVALTREIINEETTKDKKEEKPTYRVNPKALENYIKNPVTGSILYFAEKPKEREAAA
jgi:hypothetical protein